MSRARSRPPPAQRTAPAHPQPVAPLLPASGRTTTAGQSPHTPDAEHRARRQPFLAPSSPRSTRAHLPPGRTYAPPTPTSRERKAHVTRNKNTAPRPAHPTPSTPAPRRPPRRAGQGGSAPRAGRPTSGGLTSVPRRARPRFAPLGWLGSLAVRLHLLSLHLLGALARLALAAQVRCAALLATLSHEARSTLALTRRAVLTCSAWYRPHRGRVRVHVFHAQRHERIALEQELRNALRQLERLERRPAPRPAAGRHRPPQPQRTGVRAQPVPLPPARGRRSTHHPDRARPARGRAPAGPF